MTIGEKYPPDDWRNDPALSSKIEYKKKWALWPVTCSDDVRIWGKFYYKKYKLWGFSDVHGEFDYGHEDFVENITEAEYIVRKLAENL
jgi:hypothetical protein